jgi:hypothetical protein
MAYAYPELKYRGHYDVVAGYDFAGTMLSADYGGGLREDEVIFPPLKYWKLRYDSVSRRVYVQPEGNAEPKLREVYLRDFVLDSKTNGNRPFVMRCPLDNKPYLCVFDTDTLEFDLLNLMAMTTGLSIRQVYVRQMNFLPDGSIGSEIENPAQI